MATNILDLLSQLPDPRLMQPKMQGMNPMQLGLPPGGMPGLETQTSPALALRGGIQPGAYDKPQSTWDKIMGVVGKGFSAGQGQLLPEDARKAALKRGLLGSGLAMIEASGNRPQGTQPNIAQILGRGLAGGQAGYEQGLGGYLGEQQMAMQARQAEQRQALMMKYANMPQTPDTMQKLFNDLIAIGDYEGAKPIAEVLKSGMGQNKLEIVKADNGVIYAINPYTGEKVNTIGLQARDGTMLPLTDKQFQQVENITDNFHQQAGKAIEQAGSFGRVRNAAANMLSAQQQGRASEAAASALALVYAYAKLLDPGSVVREGELRLTMSQGSKLQEIMNLWEKAKTGTITPELVESMLKESIGQYQGAEQLFRREVDTAQRRLTTQMGIDPKYFVYTDPFEGGLDLIPQQWLDELGQVSISGERARAAYTPLAPTPDNQAIIDSLAQKYPYLKQ